MNIKYISFHFQHNDNDRCRSLISHRIPEVLKSAESRGRRTADFLIPPHLNIAGYMVWITSTDIFSELGLDLWPLQDNTNSSHYWAVSPMMVPCCWWVSGFPGQGHRSEPSASNVLCVQTMPCFCVSGAVASSLTSQEHGQGGWSPLYTHFVHPAKHKHFATVNPPNHSANVRECEEKWRTDLTNGLLIWTTLDGWFLLLSCL